jgi:transcription elongation factor Elf1
MFGAPNSKVKCQFCGAEGAVRVTDVTRKTGISGGKAAGAIVTGGASILATGLSQKKPAKHLSCRNCGMETDVF